MPPRKSDSELLPRGEREIMNAAVARGNRASAGLGALAWAAAAVVVGSLSPLRMVAAPQGNSSPSTPNGQRFEVASVRQEDPKSNVNYNNPAFRVVPTVFPSNRLTMRHTNLRSLISECYGVKSQYIVGGPDWLDQQRYDIDAKVEGKALLTREQMRPMLRNLLEERFHLKTHPGQKIVPGYALTIAKGGPRLPPNRGAPFLGMEGGYTMKWQNVSMERFAQALEKAAGGPVIDRTGIKGTYDFDLKFGPHGPASDDPVFAHIPENLYANLPDIFTAVQEKLGLKLVPEKISMDTLVIEHVERKPTEN